MANKQVVTPGIPAEFVMEAAQLFHTDPANTLRLNAVTRASMQDVAINREVLNSINFTFSHDVETTDVTDQKRSNTCWLFAELNWLRTFTMRKFKLKNFEFSQNYLMFWDKFEKAGFFLDNIIALIDKELDDRRVNFLIRDPSPDGGEWHLIVNLINKYGAVPKAVMPDTFNRENSRFMNEILNYRLREGAMQLRKQHAQQPNAEMLQAIKKTILVDIYRILCICLGTPPVKFDWSFRNDSKDFYRETGITPLEFAEKYIGENLNEMYCLLSCPTEDTPYNQPYSVEFFNNMTGGREWHAVNLPIEDLKKYAIKMLKDNQSCIFGCDVVQESHTKEGILDRRIFDYEALFGIKFSLNKVDRVLSNQTRLTHSMVLTGVDLVDDKPLKWKIENSWGSEVGKKGFFLMSDEWFVEHTYDLIVPRRYLSSRHLKMFEKADVMLPPWHPMA